MTQPYQRFDAWKLCHALVLEVYAISAKWPKTEMFGLTSQVRRAATSSAINLVEGSAKRGTREFRRFLDISNGSLAEVGYCLYLAKDLGYLDPENRERVEQVRRKAAGAVFNLYKSLRTGPDRG